MLLKTSKDNFFMGHPISLGCTYTQKCLRFEIVVSALYSGDITIGDKMVYKYTWPISRRKTSSLELRGEWVSEWAQRVVQSKRMSERCSTLPLRVDFKIFLQCASALGHLHLSLLHLLHLTSRLRPLPPFPDPVCLPRPFFLSVEKRRLWPKTNFVTFWAYRIMLRWYDIELSLFMS